MFPAYNASLSAGCALLMSSRFKYPIKTHFLFSLSLSFSFLCPFSCLPPCGSIIVKHTACKILGLSRPILLMMLLLGLVNALICCGSDVTVSSMCIVLCEKNARIFGWVLACTLIQIQSNYLDYFLDLSWTKCVTLTLLSHLHSN